MKLNIKERVLLLSLAPAKGDIVLLRLVQELNNALSFTEEEIKTANIQTINDRIIWEKDFEKDINIPDPIKNKIKEGLQTLSDKGELTLDYLSLWDKFFQ
jgi:hypothetical protein